MGRFIRWFAIYAGVFTVVFTMVFILFLMTGKFEGVPMEEIMRRIAGTVGIVVVGSLLIAALKMFQKDAS